MDTQLDSHAPRCLAHALAIDGKLPCQVTSKVVAQAKCRAISKEVA